MDKTREAMRKLKSMEFGILALWVLILTIFKVGVLPLATVAILRKIMVVLFCVAEFIQLKAYLNKENYEIKSDILILLIINTVMIVVGGLSL